MKANQLLQLHKLYLKHSFNTICLAHVGSELMYCQCGAFALKRVIDGKMFMVYESAAERVGDIGTRLPADMRPAWNKYCSKVKQIRSRDPRNPFIGWQRCKKYWGWEKDQRI